MIGRTLTHGIGLAVVLSMAACATTAPRTEPSILESLADQSQTQARSPNSCLAANEALVCRSDGLGSRLDRTCECVDKRAFSDPAFR